MRNDLVLVLVVITALAFDFTNGFHDTGNAMATSIATGALSPRVAVALSGVLNLVGRSCRWPLRPRSPTAW
jgi:inorganic phosphate transporter, PiT family